MYTMISASQVYLNSTASSHTLFAYENVASSRNSEVDLFFAMTVKNAFYLEAIP